MRWILVAGVMIGCGGSGARTEGPAEAPAQEPAPGSQAPEPSAAPVAVTACATDDDCVVTVTSADCCACCPLPPTAIHRADQAAAQRTCAVVDCDMQRCAARSCLAQDPAGRTASCQRGACVLD